MRKRALLAKFALLLVLSIETAFIYRSFNLLVDTHANRFEHGLSIVFTMVLCISSLIKYFCETQRQERIMLAVQLFCLLIILPSVSGLVYWQIFLAIALLVETALYERQPACFFISFLIQMEVITVSVVGKLMMGESVGLLEIVIFISISNSVSIAAFGMVYYREQLAYAQKDLDRVREALTKLTETNLEYQNYAIGIEEDATEQERNRITREVHDIVGYTLTNTIMMMEAASDMMRRNPLGIASLINTARENAQEGLQEIREAMYKFRENQIDRPKGLAAVIRMIKVFTNATKVCVEIIWNDVPWIIDDERDYLIFRCIQQGLVNAFIHGKASKVLIQSFVTAGVLTISIKDNGKGSGVEPVIEGIGLKGLRERLERLGGDYEAYSITDGFILVVHIPLAESADDNLNSITRSVR